MTDPSPDETSGPPAGRLGPGVRRVRSGCGVSLRRLAGEVGVSPATLSAIETGKTPPGPVRLRQIADALEVPVDRFALADTGILARQGSLRAGESPGGTWRDFGPLALDPVLGAALRVFVARGYHAASVRAVAEHAGLSVAGVYHHHASKHQMLVELLDATMSELRWRLLAARDTGDGHAEKVALMVESLALFHAVRGDLAFLGASEMRGLEPAERVRITGLRDEVQHLLDEEVERAVAAGELATADPRTACRAIATMCTALPSWFRPDGEVGAQEVARRYATYALALLGNVGASAGK